MNKKSTIIVTSIIIISFIIVVTIIVKGNKTSKHLNNKPVEDSKIEISKPEITLNPKNNANEYDIEYQSFKGIETDILLKNCYSLYSTYWSNEIKKYPDHRK